MLVVVALQEVYVSTKLDPEKTPRENALKIVVKNVWIKLGGQDVELKGGDRDDIRKLTEYDKNGNFTGKGHFAFVSRLSSDSRGALSDSFPVERRSVIYGIEQFTIYSRRRLAHFACLRAQPECLSMYQCWTLSTPSPFLRTTSAFASCLVISTRDGSSEARQAGAISNPMLPSPLHYENAPQDYSSAAFIHSGPVSAPNSSINNCNSSSVTVSNIKPISASVAARHGWRWNIQFLFPMKARFQVHPADDPALRDNDSPSSLRPLRFASTEQLGKTGRQKSVN
ncbi:uncharacterized protein BT62DRAFT_1000703 [Guyanagaster necrorhizus]|uniref:Uncharacterized protein n=1 Tax=Guyanagaster necrorhizus TaxID=856835 RepID=A0A9P7W3J7_9AGAR|nr:uncharacterized protein BT62DRAFT_1000703 [Guyanagaster necrorhizus MCA 3950]KAG7451454.1 hypothetical protein BT62DRAFT_1000703 [Guyanagaster necrorhizus MCA 3950]